MDAPLEPTQDLPTEADQGRPPLFSFAHEANPDPRDATLRDDFAAAASMAAEALHGKRHLVGAAIGPHASCASGKAPAQGQDGHAEQALYPAATPEAHLEPGLGL